MAGEGGDSGEGGDGGDGGDESDSSEESFQESFQEIPVSHNTIRHVCEAYTNMHVC